MSHTPALSFAQADQVGTVWVRDEGLKRHVSDCVRSNGAWHSVRCKAESVDSFVSGRFVSTIVVAAGLLALSVSL